MSRKLQYQQLSKGRSTWESFRLLRWNPWMRKIARIVFPGTEGAYSQAATKELFW
ncbi:MAG: hypothetical protein V8S14_04880 [Lachnospiraceae bacterium]